MTARTVLMHIINGHFVLYIRWIFLQFSALHLNFRWSFVRIIFSCRTKIGKCERNLHKEQNAWILKELGGKLMRSISAFFPSLLKNFYIDVYICIKAIVDAKYRKWPKDCYVESSWISKLNFNNFFRISVRNSKSQNTFKYWHEN